MAEAQDRAITAATRGWGIGKLWLTMQAMGLNVEAERKYLNAHSIPVMEAEKMTVADWLNVITNYGESFKQDLYALRDIRQADILWVRDQARKAGMIYINNPEESKTRLKAIVQVIKKDFKDPDLIKDILIKYWLNTIKYPHITDEQRLHEEIMKNTFNYQNLLGPIR